MQLRLCRFISALSIFTPYYLVSDTDICERDGDNCGIWQENTLVIRERCGAITLYWSPL